MGIIRAAYTAGIPVVARRRGRRTQERARFSRRWEEWKINNRNRPYRLLCVRQRRYSPRRARPHGRVLVSFLVFSLPLVANSPHVLLAPVRSYRLLPLGAQCCRTASAAVRFRHWRSTAIIDSVVSDRVLRVRLLTENSVTFRRYTPSCTCREFERETDIERLIVEGAKGEGAK